MRRELGFRVDEIHPSQDRILSLSYKIRAIVLPLFPL